MKIFTFFKLLNHKIKQYEMAASNQSANVRNAMIIWVEDYTEANKEKR